MGRTDDRPRAGSASDQMAVLLGMLTGRTGAWLFTVAVGAAAVAIFLVFVVPAPAYDPGEELPWPLFAVVFGLAEVAVVHLMIRNQAVSVSLSEIPLVVGFYFLAPGYLVVAQFVGAGLALVLHRRQPPLKIAFNLSMFLLGSSLAILVFRAILPLGPTNLVVWWLASFMGTATVAVLSAVAISIVISLSQRRRVLAALRSGLGFGLVTAFVNTSIALVAVVFLHTEPDQLWLLGAPAAIGLLGYRSFSAQRVRQARLEFLYECIQLLQGPLLEQAMLAQLLARTRDTFRASMAEVILARPGVPAPSRVLVDAGNVPRAESVSDEEAAGRRALLAGDESGRLFRRALVGGNHRAPSTFRDAVIVPLRGASGVIGTLMVADRVGDLDTFEHEDLRLLEALGSRLGLVAENSGLVERLAASLAEVTQLAAIVQSSEDAIVAVTAHGEITAWNPAAARLFGYEASAMLGRAAAEVLPESDRSRLRDSFTAVLSGSPTRNVRTEWLRSDGTKIPVSITISPIRGAAGETTGVSAIVRDESDRAQAEAEALASADQLRTVIDGSPIGMGIAGADLRWTQANPALCAMLGLPATDTIGRPVIDMIHPDDRTTIHRLEERLFDGAPAVRSVERRYVATGGEVLWTSVTARLIRDPSSSTPMALYMIEDITERRHVEEQARLTEERFRHATLAISAVQDPSEVIREVLQAARETLRSECAAVAVYADDGSMIKAEFDGIDAQATLERIGRWPVGLGVLGIAPATGRPIRLRDVRTHAAFGGFPEGHPSISSFLGVPIPYQGGDRSTLYVANKLDGGEFTEGDEAIAVALANHAAVCLDNARINARSRELVNDLDRANLELVNASEAKSRFLANVAHELRTPLHAILVASELVHDSPVGLLSGAKIRDFGATIQSSGRLMVHLIDDLVDLSRIEAGRLDVRPIRFPLGDLFAEIGPNLKDAAEALGITLELPDDPGPRVLADPVRLRQILANLIGNALKFTERGGRIWIEVSSKRTANTITVHDTGIGIAPQDLERAFLPFEQVSRTSTPGAGLGLAISRSLAELHGGQLEVSSTPGVGSSFILTLPRRLDTTAGRDIPTPSSFPLASLGGGRPILVVEDDPTALRLATEVLQMADYEVWQARGLVEARERLERATPALVLLDLRLGDGDGVDLARHIRADSRYPGLPILALSADAMPDDAARARAAGCGDFLSKPVSPRVLLAHIHELITAAGDAAGPPAA
jgi:PAS domain S-box-containing protein